MTLGGGDKHIIRNIVGRLHVGAPDSDVIDAIGSKLAPDNPYRDAAFAYALKVHRANRRQYAAVMSGRLA